MVAAAQAGVFSGLNPASYNPGDPIVLFIIQVTIILVFCRIIAIPLAYLKQPIVISEVIAGIILGPTVMGRIPGFQNTIFPAISLPYINLISTLGLVFFLFQVGLEVNLQVIKRDWHQSLSVAVAGMALPFGLGCAVSVGLYKLQNDPNTPFFSFLLFLGVAMSITAFPVLARILVELKLLRTKVGAIAMAAGLLNDCTAWVLLALVVALLNASGGITALYVLLTAIGFALFLIFIIRPLYRKLCIATNSFENGPSHLLMAVTLMMVLLSAFVTDIIGVHAIFGGFLAGAIVPHDNNLSIKITEKIEDIVNIIFLPLYFTLSGLKTQIGLLNTGEVWGYVILVIFLACFGKIVGCTLAARLTGLKSREAFTVGFLMNCKGLVELIVLNIGHDAGVLNDQVFVIMVVMALITTCMTTPVVDYLYPEWYQKQTNAFIHNEGSLAELDKLEKEDVSKMSSFSVSGLNSYSIIALLTHIESVPSLMALIQLLKRNHVVNPIEIHALRLLELSERTSAVMKVKDLTETKRQDPVLNVVRTFARLVGIQSLQTHVDFCPTTDYIKTVSRYGDDVHANLILVPWHRELEDVDFINSAFTIEHTNVGLFVDRGFGQTQDGDLDMTPRLIVAYQGYPDDRAALLFAFKLQAYHKIQLTIVATRFREQEGELHASKTAVHEYIQDDTALSIDTLFSSANDVSNVVCHQVDRLDSKTLLTSTTKPLSKNDLIILGRNAHIPTDETEHEKALGSLGSHVIKNIKNASVLVIRSVTLPL